MQRIGMVIKTGDIRATKLAGDIAEWLDDCGYQVFVEDNSPLQNHVHILSSALLRQQLDIMLVFGGDGTLLGVGRQFVGSGIPILGINMGRLGFLTDTPAGSVRDALSNVFSQGYKTREHYALSVEVIRDGQLLHAGVAMNDVVMHRRDTRPIEFELSIRHQHAFNLHADGMILATPAGSTAYAMSAGGPIIHPSLQAVALVPICPHTLGNRPLVISMDDNIEMQLLANSQPATLGLDGQKLASLQTGDHIHVRRGGKITLIYLPEHHYFATLRNKLHWADGATNHS